MRILYGTDLAQAISGRETGSTMRLWWALALREVLPPSSWLKMGCERFCWTGKTFRAKKPVVMLYQ